MSHPEIIVTKETHPGLASSAPSDVMEPDALKVAFLDRSSPAIDFIE